MKPYSRIALLLLFFCFERKTEAQTVPTNNTPATGVELMTPPNAAAFTQYLKVPVSQFTGAADIKVPLYNIKVDNFDLPVYLSYNSRGIQPNNHAGWVGSGWNLIADAVITRKVNGIIDEYVNTQSGEAPPNVSPSGQIGWYFPYVRGLLNNSSWNLISTVMNANQNFIPSNGTRIFADSAPDEFDFSINGISGAFFMGTDGNWKVRAQGGETIKIQEEMGSCSFSSFPSYTNNIYYTFLQFTLTTGDGTQYIFGGSDQINNPSIDFNRAGAQVNYNYNIIPMAWHITQILLPSKKVINFSYYRDGVQVVYSPYGNASNFGGSAKQNPSFTDFLTPGGALDLLATSESNQNAYNDIKGDAYESIMDPVYLRTIGFPNGTLIFNSSATTESDVLDYPNTGTTFNSSAYNGAKPANAIIASFLDLSNNVIHGNTVPSKWHELDGIELDDYNKNKLENINLSYATQANYTTQIGSSVPTTRLFLSSVQQTGYYNSSTGTTMPPYTFVYNPIVLPAYCTLQTDHWGYYNGSPTPSNHPFPVTVTYDANYFPDTAYQNAYYTFREPNPTYAQAGILTQINYPTGGYSQFTYEPCYYRKWVGGLPITVNTLSADAIGGGLRVKQIVSTDNTNLTPITYQYNYVNDLTSNVSSGVLGMPKPSYFDTEPQLSWLQGLANSVPLNINLNYEYFSSTPIYPSQNDDGNIVTYSNVIERQYSNGIYNGMKTSAFSNHDNGNGVDPNGYANNPPDAAFWILSSETSLYHYNDRAFERGLLLSEVTQDNNGNLIKQIQNTYNNDQTRFNSYVPGIFSTDRQVNITGFVTLMMDFYRTSAIRYYTYYPYLQQKVETDYPSDNSGNTVATTTNYTYDSVNGTKNLVKTVTTNSKGQLVISNTKYPLDYNLTGITPSDQFTTGISKLQLDSAVSIPVENTIQLSNADGSNLRTIASTLNSYDSGLPFPDLTYKSAITTPLTSFIPSTVAATGVLSNDASYEPRMYYDNYDTVGNLLQEHIAAGVNQAYQWGYNNTYPTVKIVNAANLTNTTTTQSNGIVSADITLPPNGNSQTYSQTINIGYSGSTTLGFTFGGDAGSNASAAVSIIISGPGYYNTIYLATSGSSYPSTQTLAGLVPGAYNISAAYAQSQNLTVSTVVDVSYPSTTSTTITSGIKEFYYEGFEESTVLGVTPGGHTGHKYYSGTSYTPGWTAPNNRSYVISYWYLLNGVWTYMPESTYMGSAFVLTGGTGYDDIRIHPSDAQMTTYTYDPLVGMTSSTDAKSETTYYEYDPFQRLMNIKDKDGNIIKHYDYNYQGQ